MPDRWKIAICTLALAVLASGYAICICAPGFGLSHDDGIYLVTAKALLSGQGYRIVSLPEPLAQTKYPPLFPAMLTLVWKLFGANLFALKLVPLLAGAVWLWLTYKLLKGEGMPKPAALAAVALTAGSGWVFFLGITLFSETLFAALLTAALLMLRRIERGPVSALSVCATGAVIGLTLLTRANGLALLAAAVLILISRRSFRYAALLLLTAGILYAPWVLWTAAHPYTGQTESYYSAANYRAWNILFSFAPADKIAVLQGNVLRMAAVPLILLDVPDRFWLFLVIPVGAALAIGFFQAISGRRSMLIPVFLVFYFGLLLLWAWPMERFAAPVLPLILYLFWRAFGKVRGAAWFRWPLLAGTLIAIVYLGWARYADCRVVMANGAYTTYNWKAVRSMAAWIERFTPPDAILAATLDPTLYLCTGRRGLRAFNLDPVALYYRGSDQAIRADEMLGEIRQSHATYLARTSPPSGGRDVLALNRAIEDMLRMRPRAFHLVYQGAPGYAVYRIDAPALD